MTTEAANESVTNRGVLPLDGVRVLDFTQFQSGPMSTQPLADLGADVIKVESIQRVDGWRGVGRGEDQWENSPAFNWANRNKRGITLNLQDERGRDLFRRLAATSDVLVENYTPRVLTGFGLGYADLRSVRADLIMVSMPGFGVSSPWRDYTAFAWTTEQMSTMCHLTGYADGPPVFTGTTGGDELAALMGAIAILAALRHRRATGEGQHVDLSQVETATSFVGDKLVEAQLSSTEPGRLGNRSPHHAPQGIYRCAGSDSWVAIACESQQQWAALAAHIGAPQALHELNLDERMARHDEIDAMINEWSSTRDAEHVMYELQSRGVIAAVVADGRRALEDPHFAARNFYLVQDRAGTGPKQYPGQPFSYRNTPLATVNARRAPYLGEHNREVLCDELGTSAETYAELERDHVIGDRPLSL
ncbi:CaiB/BaiF CoA transferase family protein [Cumulibacter soli]|uniref:CaiB/BaiF CoA transferase family protein n=1 Tax=Cumulibacter soli TaxID=2546344 RepID=UPI00106782E6|nr:CoA transferase [Cumulibacter soli]